MSYFIGKISSGGGRYSVRETILIAAAMLIKKLGYQAATTNRIAEKAGVSIGGFYHHFKGKDSVFASLMQNIIDRHYRRFQELAEESRHLSREQATQRLVDATVDFAFDHKSLLKNLFRQSAKYNKLETVFDLRNAWAESVARHIAEKEKIDPSEARARQITVVNAVNGVLDSAIFSSNFGLSRDQVKSELKRLVSPSDQCSENQRET